MIKTTPSRCGFGRNHHETSSTACGRRLRHGRPAVDTEALIRDIYVELAVARGASMPEHVFHRMIGAADRGQSDAVARAHFGAGLPARGAAGRRRRAQCCAACEIGVALKAGVSNCSTIWTRLRLPRAIATSSGHLPCSARWGRAASCRRFDAVVAAGDYARGKPNPDPFLTAAERLGVAPRGLPGAGGLPQRRARRPRRRHDDGDGARPARAHRRDPGALHLRCRDLHEVRSLILAT